MSQEFRTVSSECSVAKISCPAALPVDCTAQPQIVRAKADPFERGLLISWHAVAGRPALISVQCHKANERMICEAAGTVNALSAHAVILQCSAGRNFLRMGNARPAPAGSRAGRDDPCLIVDVSD